MTSVLVDEVVDERLPARRLAALCDPDSTDTVGAWTGPGVEVVRGRIADAPVVAFCTDATTMAGAIGAEDSRRIVHAIELALAEGCPVIGLWHSGGARLADGVRSMDGVGRVFAAITEASGRIPQISVVLGPAAGAAAYGPALTDVVVMSSAGRVFVTGPDVVQSVTGERVDMAGLGGPDVHSRSGVVHVVTATEAEALDRARAITTLLARQGTFDVAGVRADADPRRLLPTRARRAYDVRPLVRDLLDAGTGFEELQARWAPNLVVGWGRLAGRTVGVVANNPLRKAGCLDSLSAEKASRFVRMCDSFGVPLVVVVDVPGYLPGTGQEWEGVVRRGAKLLHAFAGSVVPRVTLITRKAYGGAYIAMNSRSLHATAVFAWPEAEVAVMSATAAVGVLHRRALAAAPDAEREALRASLVTEHERVAGGVGVAMEIGVVDEVIEPRDTRRRLAEALAAAPQRRGRHTNIPL
ncbi:acyl-CoA carboxylase subunit beta [Micromonospora sp. R77]|uniref:acyl-CoA carboxylase subunit beta n=1 Tax=Micromonospora sp. R77 TaxID=2925836 RepID=UPI001F60B717|nr:carboxyl transferase domain-containing protein [Micromonospora sp. R77]MCI4065586.1 acyl-CoA carboxylase subunit beta [Micromonospora sp. R77]